MANDPGLREREREGGREALLPRIDNSVVIAGAVIRDCGRITRPVLE